MPSVSREDLERQVAEIMNLPSRGRGKGEAHRYVKAVLGVMTDALWRGEPIEIAGIGLFRVETRPAHQKSVSLYPGCWTKKIPRPVITVAPRRYVAFYPAPSIEDSLNAY